MPRCQYISRGWHTPTQCVAWHASNATADRHILLFLFLFYFVVLFCISALIKSHTNTQVCLFIKLAAGICTHIYSYFLDCHILLSTDLCPAHFMTFFFWFFTIWYFYTAVTRMIQVRGQRHRPLEYAFTFPFHIYFDDFQFIIRAVIERLTYSHPVKWQWNWKKH